MIEIYTDAAYNHNTKQVGWAYLIKDGDEFMAQGCGVAVDKGNIQNAELWAIFMALIGFYIYCPTEHSVLFWCDNLPVCNMLMRTSRSYDNMPARDKIITLLHQHKTTYYTNFIPRCSNVESSFVDELAKKQVWQP